MPLFDPHELNLPESFPTFRLAQEEALEYILTSDKRFTCLSLPPGTGKSAIAFGLARILGGRTIILTSDLGLQAQYMDDFSSAGLVTIQGRRNYDCWGGGTCEDGSNMGCADHLSCPYKIAYSVQATSSEVITNYAYWLAINEHGNQTFAMPDTLICDESHKAVEWLSRSLDFTLTERELYDAGCRLALPSEAIDVWIMTATALKEIALLNYQQKRIAAQSYRGLDRERAARAVKQADDLVSKISKLEMMTTDNWVCTKDENRQGRVWKFECVWPGMYKEKLFRHVPRVVLLSATNRPKTLQLLGIKATDYDFKEWPRQFSSKNGPVIWLKTTRVNAKMKDEDKQVWLSRHLDYLSKRNDRRVLINTVSYGRAKEISDYLGKHKRGNGLDGNIGPIVLNGSADPDSATANEAFDKHCLGPANSILCSPSFGTGWDFKGTRAECNIISKLPIPDTRSKVMQARMERDNSYSDYVAAQELKQSCGRVQRTETDKGETVILDDSWQWFKMKAAEHLGPHFKVRREDEIPPALEKLKES